LLLGVNSFAQDKSSISVPLVAIGNPEAKNKIEFFLSPSCPMCASAFRNTIIPLIYDEKYHKDNFILIYVFPRSDADIEYARLLTCVPQEKLLGFMTAWYVYRTKGELTSAALRQMGKRYGMVGNSNASCTSEINDQMFLNFNRFIFEKLKIKNTPAVFFNGKHIPDVVYLWQLQGEMK
jgi:protein-disulfide isomerase